MSDEGLLLVQLAALVGAAQMAGALMRRWRQPQVIGEMLAGIALGPTFFKLVAPNLFAALFPSSSLSVLVSMNNFGIVLFVYLIGLRFDLTHLRQNGSKILLLSNVSIIVPFVLGFLFAQYLYARYGSGDPVVFSLFLGTVMSVTALPVLARILHERGLEATDVGSSALACAAFNDFAAWILLAIVVSLSSRRDGRHSLWMTAFSLCVFIAFLVALRYVLEKRFLRRPDAKVSPMWASGCLILALVSGAAGDFLGIHSLVLAFFAGLCTPRQLASRVIAISEPLTVLFLMPVFFALTGMRTDLWGAIREVRMVDFAAIVLIASLGKWGATTVTGVATGMKWREACRLGILMNTRGLVELVILNVGLDLHILSKALFSMLVCMAILTTVVAAPLTTWTEYQWKRDVSRSEELLLKPAKQE